MSDKSLNLVLNRYHYILNQSIDVDRKLIDVFFIILSNHISLKENTDLNLNSLYIYLNKALFKLSNSTEKTNIFLNNNEIQVVLQNMIQNREKINDDYLIFQVLENILIFYKECHGQEDDMFFFQLISLIIVKIIFKDFDKDVLPLSSGLTFLTNIITSQHEILSEKELHKIAPGIITKLIKVLGNNFKHDTGYFKVVLTLLTKTIHKCKDHFSKNEKILIYQSLNVMITKNWAMTYKSGNNQIDTIILEEFIIPLKDFELVSELLIIEYLYRYESYADDSREVFDFYSIANVLCEKTKMIDVLYFDLKTFKIFKNGLMKLASDDKERCLFFKQFDSFVEYGYTKPKKQTSLNKTEVQLPSHIGENALQNRDVAVKFLVNEKVDSFSQIDGQLLDIVLNNEIKGKWLELANVWQMFFTEQQILEVMDEYSTNDENSEKRTYLYYYIFFQKTTPVTKAGDETDDIINALDSIDIDDFLVFSDDEPSNEIETPNETMLDHFLQIIDVSPTEVLAIPNAYFMSGFITNPATSLTDLKDLETELIPMLLTNIDTPIAQYSLQSLSARIYPDPNPLVSFQKMITANTDIILSHVSAMITSSNFSNQQMWIVFTKNVFQVCGIDVVSKADDVFNLMFDLLAMKSLSSDQRGNEVVSIMDLFGVVFDLIIGEYGIKQDVSTKCKATSLTDVVELLKTHEYMADSDDEDIEEVNAVVPASNEFATADEPAYTGQIAEHVYSLVIELLGYTERIYPLLADSSNKTYATVLMNIKKVCLILNTSAKNYLPQLAQVIFPFIEKLVKYLFVSEANSSLVNNKTELIKSHGHVKNQVLVMVLEILTLIVRQQASFMFTRVSELYFEHLHGVVHRYEGLDRVLGEFKKEMMAFVLSDGGLVVKDRDILKLK